MAVAIVLILGVVSFLRIPIDLMPEVTFPTVTINTRYENVGPQEIETLVTEPIEKAVSSVAGVEEVNSVSVEDRSQIRVSFGWGTDLDEAVSDLRAKIDRIRDDLPRDSETPVIAKFDANASPIMFIGISGDMDSVSLRRFVEDQIQYRLERLRGVAAADIRGGLEREIHVDLFLDKVRALNISPAAVIRALRAENVNLPAGHIDRAHLEVTVRTLGEFTNLDQIRNTVLTSRGGTPIYVRDVAEVKDSYKEIDHVVKLNGRNAVVISLRRQPLANTVAVVERVKKEIHSINQDYHNVSVKAMRDTARYIRDAIYNVRRAALWGAMLAVLILLFFLRNVRSTLIIGTAVPVSVIATFSIMYFQGFSVNIMSFGGLALGIGLLVDNSIVVLENIFRHKEQGAERKEAVLKGTWEVAGAITASTLTTLVVFLPLLFVPGSAGILFEQLAWVVFFSLATSLIVALTLVPVMTYQLLGTVRGSSRGGFLKGFFDLGERFLLFLDEHYQAFLSWALGHRTIVLVSVFSLLALSFTLFPLVGQEFMPKADEGSVTIYANMEEGARIEEMDVASSQLESLVRKKVPEVENIFSHFGQFGFRARGKNQGHVHIWLGPRKTRERSDKEIARSLRREVRSVPGLLSRVRTRSGLYIFRRLGLAENDNMEVHVRGHDLKRAQLIASQIKGEMEQIEGLAGVRINRQGGQPEMALHIDREKAANLGIPVATIAQAMQTSLGGTRATLYREGGDEFDVIVRMAEQDRRSFDGLSDLVVSTASGRAVPVKSLVRLEERRGPMEIHRMNQERVVSITGEVSDRDMDEVALELGAILRRLDLPPGFSLAVGGDYQEQQEAFRELRWGLILALLLVYMVMAALFEKFLDPLVIMFSGPFAIIGILLMLILTGTTLNVNSFIGIIMLTGIVVNNAIVLVDYINLKIREEGLSIREAVVHGGRTRLRPILMTSLTTMLAMIPLALGLGDGGEVQAPMARVVIGGLATSTLITLVLIPVLYTTVKERSSVATWNWAFSRWRLANGRVFKK
jgi:HAE1 family hydrophobic/amphiphilic exporter-1